MSWSRSLTSWTAVIFLAVLGLVPVAAQSCATGTDTFWKRDALPAVPSGLTAVSVIQGLCEGESAGVVFEMPAGMPPQRVTQVVAPWGAAGGIAGFSALLDIEIYDGVSFSGATVNMGTRVFSLSGTGANLQVASHGLNVQDLTAFSNIVVGNAAPTGSPPVRRFAICFRVDINNHPTGSCASGWPANFFTDNASNPFGPCNNIITPLRTSIIEIQGQGWRDAALATVSGFPLCPLFYSGVWAIRCCTRNAAPPNPFQILPLSPLPAASPSTMILQFQAAPAIGYPYIAAASLATSPGIPTPYGTINLAPDGLFQYSLTTPNPYFLNFQGVIGATGTGTGLVNIPAGVNNLILYFAFVVVAPNGTLGISDTLLASIQ